MGGGYTSDYRDDREVMMFYRLFDKWILRIYRAGFSDGVIYARAPEEDWENLKIGGTG